MKVQELTGENNLQLSSYDWLLTHHRAKYEARRQMVTELGLRPGDAVLDIGCGPGFWSLMMAEQVAPNGRVVGLDFDSDLIARAEESRRGHPQSDLISFQAGDFHDLPFPAASFDIALIGNALCYVDDPLPLIVNQMRVVRPGGRFMAKDFDGAAMIFHPVDPALQLQVLAAAAQSLIDLQRNDYFDNFIGRKTYGLLKAAGLSDVRVTSYAIQMHAPLSAEQTAYIRANALWTSAIAGSALDSESRRAWELHFDPASDDYVLARDDFYFCTLEMLTTGVVDTA